jgi:hypothetical protein
MVNPSHPYNNIQKGFQPEQRTSAYAPAKASGPKKQDQNSKTSAAFRITDRPTDAAIEA